MSVIGALILIPLSQEYVTAGAAGDSYYQTIGTLAIKGHDTAFELAMLVLSLGSLMLCYLLFPSKLIPRSLSALGLIGYIALLASSCLAIFGVDVSMILYIPGAIFEIIFPLWLIVKGFNINPIDSSAVKKAK